jgi:hypothetical protein
MAKPLAQNDPADRRRPCSNSINPLWQVLMILPLVSDLRCLSAISPDEATVSPTGTLMDVLERLIAGLS